MVENHSLAPTGESETSADDQLKSDSQVFDGSLPVPSDSVHVMETVCPLVLHWSSFHAEMFSAHSWTEAERSSRSPKKSFDRPSEGLEDC